MAQEALGARYGLILVDADVLIDVQRGHDPALRWLAAIGEAEFAIPGIVTLEMLSDDNTRSLSYARDFL